MWVEGGDIQDELFDQLAAVLTAPDELVLTPSVAELEALAAAVAARWPDGASAPVHHIRTAGSHPLRRLGSSAWRAGTVAAAVVLFSASAAAAAGGVPLPRPVRAVAYTVGLPVDSPALDDTNHHIKDLKAAVKANDQPKAVAAVKRLTTDLAKVPAEEKKEAEQKVDAVIESAKPLIVAGSPTPVPTSPEASSSTTATSPASSTTATTAGADEKAPAPATTTTTAAATTTTTAAEPTTTTSAPATDQTPSDGSGTPSGDPGTGSGDPAAGGAGSGGGDQGSTTPTTTPDDSTTTTTAAGGGASGGGDPTTTTTTTTSSSTTTTTMPPSDGGTGTP